MSTPISLRDYAKHREERGLVGSSPMAVSKAIKSGRLVASVVRDHRGQPKIADVALADAEWESTTDYAKAPGSVRERASASGAAPGRGAAPPDSEGPASFNEESAREKHWKANLAELDFKKRSGELVEAKEMGDKITDVFTRVRQSLLGIPTRARQQLPHLTMDDFTTLDSLVREALEHLALELEHEDEKEAAAG